MRPLSRKHVNKHSSAKKFRHNVGRTARINVQAGPMRGGIRL
nr:MAG: DNA binding protein [Microviridae sp.]